jgi:hypothetical protein
MLTAQQGTAMGDIRTMVISGNHVLAENALVTEKKLGIAEIHLCWLEIRCLRPQIHGGESNTALLSLPAGRDI